MYFIIVIIKPILDNSSNVNGTIIILEHREEFALLDEDGQSDNRHNLLFIHDHESQVGWDQVATRTIADTLHAIGQCQSKLCVSTQVIEI